MKHQAAKRANRKIHAAGILPAAVFGIGLAAPALPARADVSLEEVIVTAQRREQSLQEVPISVAAFSRDALSRSGVNATIALPQLVPSLQLVRSGPSAMFFVRGVGNSSGGTGEEGANAFYVDGVFLPDVKQAALKFNNIERIEVLKGPQGTLFGRNSSGGLVNVITHGPGDTVEAKLNLGLASYQTYTSQAYLAGPLTDTLSADIALTGTDQGEGWGQDRITGKDVGRGWDWGMRSKWVWQASDTTKITVAGEYVESSDDFTTAFRLAQGSVGILGTLPPRDPYDTNTPDDQFTDMESWGFTLTAEFDLDWATLTSITGTRDNRNDSAFDADTGPATLAGMDLAHIELEDSSSSVQQELRLASSAQGRWSWQAGLFFLRTEAELDPQTHTGYAFTANPDPVAGGEHSVFSTLDTSSYAAFGEVSYDLGDSTLLTAGVRYTHDKLEFEAEQIPLGTNPRPAFFVDDSMSAEEPTWRLALMHDITGDLNVYASYNRGFKSGTYSMSSPLVEPVEPQKIDAYEVGMKSRLLDDRLRLNLAGFHYDINEYQVRSATGNSPTAILLNAAEVEIDGVEFEFEALPIANLRLFGALTWLDAEFSDFPFAPFAYPRPAVCTPGGPEPGISTGAPTGGLTTCIGSAKGNDTPLAPEYAGNVGATWTLAVGGAGEMEFSVLYSYNDGYYFETDNRLAQPDFSTVNASISYRPTPDWTVELWGRNLGDDTYYVQKLGLSSLGDNGIPAAPRTYGLNLGYTY